MEDNEIIDFDFGLDTRKDILVRSLMIESLTSQFLSNLLGIYDVGKTKSFSNKSSSISFNQKIHLLLDMGILTAPEQKKCISFMEIRNQFMHNVNAISYVDCLKYLDGVGNQLLKLYPQAVHLPIETQCKNAVFELSNDVLLSISKVLGNVNDKLTNDVKAEVNQRSFKLLVSSLKEAEKIIDEHILKQVEKRPTLKASALKGTGAFTTKLVYALFAKNSMK